MLEDTPRTFIGATTFQVTATQPVDRTDVAHAVGEAGYTLTP